MDIGRLYFIEESYFKRFADENLLVNHVNDNDSGYRPYLIVSQDRNNDSVYWAVPISSKIEKYQALYDSKVAKSGRCDTIVVDRFHGKDAAFVIQNICPMTEGYIKNQWTKKDGSPLVPQAKVARRVAEAADRVIKKVFQNDAIITYPNIKEMYRELNAEIRLEQAMPILKKHSNLLYCTFAKNTANGSRGAAISVTSKDPTEIFLIERVINDGRFKTKTTYITEPRFVGKLESILSEKWDIITPKKGYEEIVEKRRVEQFDQRLESATSEAEKANSQQDNISLSEKRNERPPSV